MEKYIPILKTTQLLSGVDTNEISAMLNCLQAHLRTYQKGEYVLRQGDHICNILLLVEGTLHIQSDDYWGNRSIVNIISVGEMFGEAYVAAENDSIVNDVLAVEDCTVISFSIEQILRVCSAACRFHSMVIRNLFLAISEKNRRLMQKLGYISRRTTREKLISYLSDEAKRHSSSEFTIPFNRQQLADFLSVDRSAMSNELCKMRDEGMLEFQKNRFILL